MTFYIDFIADYGAKTGIDDLAFSEVDRRLIEEFDMRNLGFPFVKNMCVNPFNTIETGFVVAQLAHNSKLGASHIVYHNTAPRKDELSARMNNAGEFLAVAELPNGVRVIGAYSGYSFSFLGAKVYKVKCATDGSQFRSRDVFPPCVASLAKHAGQPLQSWELLGEEVLLVPPVPENIICSIDGYGNIKTNVHLMGTARIAEINGIPMSLSTGTGIFSVPDGSLIMAPGSSGWNGNHCAEICLRGGSAAEMFGNPKPGDRVIVR
ncbi:MAG: SAM-dependent chlorinase/fluorinase [Alphaproteobacteria bacterium]|nr:SAM-dependent chlorinase/fluorinase [Alphaproteobacteria bacterium]